MKTHSVFQSPRVRGEAFKLGLAGAIRRTFNATPFAPPNGRGFHVAIGYTQTAQDNAPACISMSRTVTFRKPTRADPRKFHVAIDGRMLLPVFPDDSIVSRSTANDWLAYALHETFHAVYSVGAAAAQRRTCVQTLAVKWGTDPIHIYRLLNSLEDPRIEGCAIAHGTAAGFPAIAESLVRQHAQPALDRPIGSIAHAASALWMIAYIGRAWMPADWRADLLSRLHPDLRPAFTSCAAEIEALTHWTFEDAVSDRALEALCAIADRFFTALKDFKAEDAPPPNAPQPQPSDDGDAPDDGDAQPADGTGTAPPAGDAPDDGDAPTGTGTAPPKPSDDGTGTGTAPAPDDGDAQPSDDDGTGTAPAGDASSGILGSEASDPAAAQPFDINSARSGDLQAPQAMLDAKAHRDGDALSQFNGKPTAWGKLGEYSVEGTAAKLGAIRHKLPGAPRIGLQLRRLLSQTAHSETRRGLRAGRVNPLALPRALAGAENVFQQRIAYGQDRCAIAIAIDLSQSMYGSRLNAARSALMLILDALRGATGSQSFVYGFGFRDRTYTAPTGETETSMLTLKDWNEPIALALRRVPKLQASGGTPILEATAYGLRMLSTRKQCARRVLLTLTDGDGFGEDQMRDFADAAGRRRIAHIGVGVQSDVRRYYRHALNVYDLADLAGASMRTLVDVILREFPAAE